MRTVLSYNFCGSLLTFQIWVSIFSPMVLKKPNYKKHDASSRQSLHNYQSQVRVSLFSLKIIPGEGVGKRKKRNHFNYFKGQCISVFQLELNYFLCPRFWRGKTKLDLFHFREKSVDLNRVPGILCITGQWNLKWYVPKGLAKHTTYCSAIPLNGFLSYAPRCPLLSRRR